MVDTDSIPNFSGCDGLETVLSSAIDGNYELVDVTNNVYSNSTTSSSDEDRAAYGEETESMWSQSIKEELRTKIQLRRLSSGVGELKVEFEPPKVYALTPEEEVKSEIRKQRNRRSALKSRKKRKRYEDVLEKESNELLEKHQKLSTEVNSLKKYKAMLEQIYKKHMGTNTCALAKRKMAMVYNNIPKQCAVQNNVTNYKPDTTVMQNQQSNTQMTESNKIALIKDYLMKDLVLAS